MSKSLHVIISYQENVYVKLGRRYLILKYPHFYNYHFIATVGQSALLLWRYQTFIKTTGIK